MGLFHFWTFFTSGLVKLWDLWTYVELWDLWDLWDLWTSGFVDLWDLFTCGLVGMWDLWTCELVICDLGWTGISFATEGTTLSMQDRTFATSDGLRVPSPERAPLYLCRTVRWRHRTDCEFLHHRGHHSIYAGPYGGDIGRTASSFTIEVTTLSMQDRTVCSPAFVKHNSKDSL